jgi:hypothetical protein
LDTHAFVIAEAATPAAKMPAKTGMKALHGAQVNLPPRWRDKQQARHGAAAIGRPTPVGAVRAFVYRALGKRSVHANVWRPAVVEGVRR